MFELAFAPSRRSTVGIEWELGLVDVDTGDMRQAAPAIMAELDLMGEHPHIQQEFMQNTVELVSGVADNVAAAGRDIYQTSNLLRSIVDPMRVGFISSGTHP
ncbi:MAG: glutamate-cysteine ligase family protein, partial [Promicromonosporaceae bacterium]|nr:glutamate-cysteine ligase family protein [Promicromonosporaceae bacterium]